MYFTWNHLCFECENVRNEKWSPKETLQFNPAALKLVIQAGAPVECSGASPQRAVLRWAILLKALAGRTMNLDTYLHGGHTMLGSSYVYCPLEANLWLRIPPPRHVLALWRLWPSHSSGSDVCWLKVGPPDCHTVSCSSRAHLHSTRKEAFGVSSFRDWL